MQDDSPTIMPDDEATFDPTSETKEPTEAGEAILDEAVIRAVEHIGELVDDGASASTDDDDDGALPTDGEPTANGATTGTTDGDVPEPEGETAGEPTEPTPEEAAAESLWGGSDDEGGEDDADGEAAGENPFAAAEGAVRDAHHQLRLGIAAFRDVREATQRHADAREELRLIQETLEAHANELRHRIDIEERYPQIVAEQTAELEAARALSAESIARAEELDAQRGELEDDLATLKAQNEERLRPYRQSAEFTKGRADDTARALRDAKSATKRAENALNEAKRNREQAISSAHRDLDNAQERLRNIQAELGDVLGGKESEDPNETREAAIARLENDQTSAQAQLKATEQKVESVTQDGRTAVEGAQQSVFDLKQKQKQAEREADAAKKEANARRSEYERMLKDAQGKENALSDRIKKTGAAADAARREHDDAEARIEIAQELLDEAELIHATPQDTIDLREQIVHEQADLDAAQDQVEALAAAERDLRRGTRKQRLILIIAAVVAVGIIVGIVVALVMNR